jgi:hypothetical protein
MAGTCGWSCTVDGDCSNVGNNNVCFRGMCTCQIPASGQDGVDISDSPRTYVCPGTAPCTDIVVAGVPLIDTVGCVGSNTQCFDEFGVNWLSNCPLYSTCSTGSYGFIVNYPNNVDYMQCDGQDWTPGTYTGGPCPIAQHSRCFDPYLQDVGGDDCGPYYNNYCCFCGNKEWNDRSKYCSRSTFDWFDCVKDNECSGGQTCSYDAIADYGFCS